MKESSVELGTLREEPLERVDDCGLECGGLNSIFVRDAPRSDFGIRAPLQKLYKFDNLTLLLKTVGLFLNGRNNFIGDVFAYNSSCTNCK